MNFSDKQINWLISITFISGFAFALLGGLKFQLPINTASEEEILSWAESREDCYTGKMYYNEQGVARVATAGSTCGKK